MRTLRQDISFGLRMLRKSPGFTSVAIVTLALGIGANSAIFILLDGLALRDLSVPHPEQLARFGAQPEDDTYVALSVPMFEQIWADQRVFSSMFAWSRDYLSTVEINGNLSRRDIWAVTGSFYSELGGTSELGRLIGPQDDDLKAASPNTVAVLAHVTQCASAMVDLVGSRCKTPRQRRYSPVSRCVLALTSFAVSMAAFPAFRSSGLGAAHFWW